MELVLKANQTLDEGQEKHISSGLIYGGLLYGGLCLMCW